MNPATPMNPVPVTLSNEFVTLEPLALAHATDLLAALDDRVFAFMPMRAAVRTLDDVEQYIQSQNKRPNAITFAVIDHSKGGATGKAIGSTSHMNIRAEHRGLEIGSTWISASSRGTKINPSMKYLMLEHAFDELGAIRVELKTDARNAQSRAAILKLGAQFEGIMRQHMVMPDGYLRDTAMFSITDSDWASVRDSLIARIGV